MSHIPCKIKETLKDSVLRERLLKRENIPLLEKLINTESQKFLKLKERKRSGKLDFGRAMGPEDAGLVFGEIKKEVDAFTGAKDVVLPRIVPYHLLNFSTSALPLLIWFFGLSIAILGLFFWIKNPEWIFSLVLGVMAFILGYKVIDLGVLYSSGLASHYSYNALTRTIVIPADRLRRKTHVDTMPILAHEYAHHILRVRGFGVFSGEFKIFKEGYALGVQRHVAEWARRRDNNEAFLYDAMDEVIGEMQGIYVWLCRHFNRPLPHHLEWVKTSRRALEPIRRAKYSLKKPSVHAMGNVLFFMYESKHGKDIYKKIFEKALDF